MPSTMKMGGKTRSLMGHTIRRRMKTNAAPTIRRIGSEWARRWNAGELHGVVAAYFEDAVYLPPSLQSRSLERCHSRVCENETPGVRLAFAVKYIKQQEPIPWDVGMYRMTIPQNDGTRREDHGKYLTVWRCVGNSWLIVADSWPSDLPPSACCLVPVWSCFSARSIRVSMREYGILERRRGGIMELILTAEEQELLRAILEQRHQELLKEIAHTDHREFKQALRKNEKLLVSMLGRVRGAAVQELRP